MDQWRRWLGTVGAFISVMFAITFTPVEAGTVPCHLYDPGDSISEGFGVPWNVVSPEHELFLKAFCTDVSTNIDIEIGNNQPNTYVWSTAYYWENNQWNPFALSCAQSDGLWCVGTGAASFTTNSASNPHYVVGYVCHYLDNRWYCGCRDSACAQGFWQLQTVRDVTNDAFSRPTIFVGISGGSLLQGDLWDGGDGIKTWLTLKSVAFI